MRCSTFAAIAVLTLAACQGPAGKDGLPGRDGRLARTPSYCNVQDLVVEAAGNWAVAAGCSNVQDIPLSGDCSAPQGLPPGAIPLQGTPVDWDNMAAIAIWNCQWTWEATATPTAFMGRAEICCATP